MHGRSWNRVSRGKSGVQTKLCQVDMHKTYFRTSCPAHAMYCMHALVTVFIRPCMLEFWVFPIWDTGTDPVESKRPGFTTSAASQEARRGDSHHHSCCISEHLSCQAEWHDVRFILPLVSPFCTSHNTFDWHAQPQSRGDAATSALHTSLESFRTQRLLLRSFVFFNVALKKCLASTAVYHKRNVRS